MNSRQSALAAAKSVLAASVAAVTDGEMLEDEEVHQYLTFNLGGEVFAIGILSIKEILGYNAPTAVPMAPPWIRGVINLRGAVVPLLDLQMRFGRTGSEPTKKTCSVILEVRGGQPALQIGVVVDQVNEVVEILPGQIEPPPGFGARIRSDFMVGMGKVGERFVILLDMNRVLSLEEISQIGRAESALAA